MTSLPVRDVVSIGEFEEAQVSLQGLVPSPKTTWDKLVAAIMPKRYR